MWSDPHHLQESYWWLPCPFVWCTWIAPASLRRIWYVVSSFWSYKGIRCCWLLWLLLSLQILSWVGNQGIFWFGHSIHCLPFQKVIYKSIDLFGCQRLKYQNVIAEISLEFCHFSFVQHFFFLFETFGGVGRQWHKQFDRITTSHERSFYLCSCFVREGILSSPIQMAVRSLIVCCFLGQLSWELMRHGIGLLLVLFSRTGSILVHFLDVRLPLILTFVIVHLFSDLNPAFGCSG